LEEIPTSLIACLRTASLRGPTLAAVGLPAAAFQMRDTGQMSEAPWSTGSVVRLKSGGEALRVIGCDSVGSVICRRLHDEGHPSIYVPPSLLVAADTEVA
jgi:uncharacterized protein YodC (DUF2158 family)